MAYARAGLSGPLQLGFDKHLYYYTSTADSIATVVAAGYFTNSTDNLRFVTGDLMTIKGSNNLVATAECINVSTTGDGVTFYVLHGQDGFVETSTGGALSVYGTSFLNSTAAFTLHTPAIRAGHRKTIVALVAAPTVTTTGGSNLVGAASTNVITFSAAYASLDLMARTSTAWVVLGGSLLAIGGSATGEATVRTS